MSLLQLPTEILQAIVFNLATQDIPAFALTCSTLNNTLNCPSLWESRLHRDFHAEGEAYVTAALNRTRCRSDPRRIYKLMHCLWTTSSTDNSWRIEFRQPSRHQRHRQIAPEYWVRIYRQMRLPPGKYAVRWNLEMLQEYPGQVVFQITLDDDGDAVPQSTDSINEKIEIETIENVAAAAPSPTTPLQSVVVCESVLSRPLLHEIYTSTTAKNTKNQHDLESNGLALNFGNIEVPKLNVKGREWRYLTISIELQRGFNPDLKIHSITLDPVREDMPLSPPNFAQLDPPSSPITKAAEQRRRRVLLSDDDKFDEFAHVLKCLIGNVS